jgi:anti-sigma regulatory factor (Ser/Thr protein kinase)
MRVGSAEYDVELDVADGHDSVAAVRQLVRDSLTAWRYRGRHDDAVLIISELVTNALLHGVGVPVLRLAGTSWRLRVEVSDDSPELPAIREAGADGGWGLRLLDELSLGWGVVPRDNGKVVWCELGTVLAPVGSGVA